MDESNQSVFNEKKNCLYQLISTANPAQLGRIGCPTWLVTQKDNDAWKVIFFFPHFCLYNEIKIPKTRNVFFYKQNQYNQGCFMYHWHM